MDLGPTLEVQTSLNLPTMWCHAENLMSQPIKINSTISALTLLRLPGQVPDRTMNHPVRHQVHQSLQAHQVLVVTIPNHPVTSLTHLNTNEGFSHPPTFQCQHHLPHSNPHLLISRLQRSNTLTGVGTHFKLSVCRYRPRRAVRTQWSVEHWDLSNIRNSLLGLRLLCSLV